MVLVDETPLKAVFVVFVVLLVILLILELELNIDIESSKSSISPVSDELRFSDV